MADLREFTKRYKVAKRVYLDVITAYRLYVRNITTVTSCNYPTIIASQYEDAERNTFFVLYEKNERQVQERLRVCVRDRERACE